MKSCRTVRSVSLSSLFALVLCALSLLGSCRAPLVGTGPSSRATISLSIVGSPPASRSSSSRLILPNASWIRLTLTDGLESETYTQAEASPTFTVTVVVDREYNLVAEAGTTSEGEDTILYRGSTTFTAAGYQTISLNLLPNEIEAWPEIVENYTFEGSIYGQNSVTYRVRMGSAARWYVDGYTGDETDLQLYFQNEDGSAVTPAVSMADRLIVEKSMLTADANSFLLTLYNASTDTGSYISPEMTSARAYTGDLVYCDTVATIATNSLPADITFLGGKLYVAMNTGSRVVSLDTDGTNETVFYDGSTTYTTPWGITNDGTDIYVAFQYGGNNGDAAKIDTSSATTEWNAAIPRASGIAVLDDYVYVTSNTENKVYRVLKESSGNVTAEIVAGSGEAVSYDADGESASFNSPAGICTDGTYLYVVDAGSFIIRRIDPTTTAVTTFAGSGTSAIVEGTGTAASFSGINHIISDGTYLYVTDSNTLRRIDIATRQVETIYEFSGFNGDGLAKVGDAFYVVDNENHVFRVY